jgi:hypothetical protein
LDLVIPSKKTFKVKIYDVDYTIGKPTLGQMESFIDGLDNLNDLDKMKKSKSLVSSLGIPMEVLDQLEVEHFSMLMDFLTSAVKKKLSPLEFKKYELMHFYSMSLEEINKVAYEEISKMYQAMEIITARKVLLGFKISSFPEYSKQDKSKEHKEFYKIAYPDIFIERRKLSLKDIAGILGGANRG